MFEKFRHRANRRLIALFAVFAVALSGTGIASLAILTDQASVTVNASITTIDLRVNGTKSATINLPDGLVPGDLAYASLHITNSGTGWVRVTPSASVQSGGGTQLVAGTIVKYWSGVAPAQCGAGNGLDATGGVALNGPALGGSEFTIDAGSFRDYCAVYRVGQTGASYTDGGTSWSQLISLAGLYP